MNVYGRCVLQHGLQGAALFSALLGGAAAAAYRESVLRMVHQGMGSPMATSTALTLRLAPTVPLSLLAPPLLGAALVLATVQGWRDGRLLALATLPIHAATGTAPA